MRELVFNYRPSAQVAQAELNSLSAPLKTYVTTLRKVVTTADYQHAAASLILPGDVTWLKAAEKLAAEKLALKPTMFILVGIGGSNLGTVAVLEAVLGKNFNLLPKTKIKFFCADTVDSDNTAALIQIIKQEIAAGGRVILNGVSKSGSTTETISLFQVLLQTLRQKQKNYRSHVVITSDRNSPFWQIGEKEKFSLLEIPAKVGGRFSVFSSVGLFPLSLLGINVKQLLTGAKTMRERSLAVDLKDNPALISAGILAYHLKKHKNINDNFIFDVNLEAVGKWYRQLLGESIGKEKNLQGQVVHSGLTPTVSIGSVDLHSMAQLYLGGPYDKLTTFIGVEKVNQEIQIPTLPAYANLVEGIQGRTLSEVMAATYQGTKNAFAKGKRPFTDILLPDRKEASVGQLLQFKMLEIMYLAQLLGVNAFDQPNVEDYKRETRKLLQD